MSSLRLVFTSLSFGPTSHLIVIQIGRNAPKDTLATQIYAFACQLDTRRQHVALGELVCSTRKLFTDLEMRLESTFSLSKEQKVRA
jgi:hypothetical protein